MDVNEIINKLLESRPMMFSNPVGSGFVGGKIKHTQSGSGIVVINPRRIKYGLCPGSADYIGWTSIEITPDMVGKKIAVFTSCEIKTENDRLSKEQRTWNKIVRKDGGIAEVWKENQILTGGEIE
jgi:hypothetical protein